MARSESNKFINLLRYGDEAGPGAAARKLRKSVVGQNKGITRRSRLRHVALLLDDDCTTEPEVMTQKLGVGRRTLYRDLVLLRRAGVRLTYKREERRYILDSLYVRLAMTLTRNEVAAFLQWLDRNPPANPESRDPLQQALRKIGQVLQDHTKSVLKHEPKPPGDADREPKNMGPF